MANNTSYPSDHGSPYAVPFRVCRDELPVLRLRNISSETLRGVTAWPVGDGALLPPGPQIVAPGNHAEFVMPEDDLATRTVIAVRWFRPSGDEYLWRVSF